ncbi:MAG: histidine kinase dimerization/phospho-acceptor domain-containing protein [Candidatus Omnitrophota bacterium]
MFEPKDRKDFTRIIYRESGRLAKLIDDLLDLSKIESGKITMTFASVEIGPVIKRTMGILERSAAEKAISIKF